MPASRAQQAATADRRTKAIALHLAGMDWQAIADQLGYASRGAAHTDVTRALKANLTAEAEQVEEMRYTVSLRLERLQASMWPKAVKGDTRAADTCLKIITQWCKIHGVEAPAKIALEHRLDLEGQLVADAVAAALDVLGLTEEQRIAALGAAQQRLLDNAPGDPA